MVKLLKRTYLFLILFFLYAPIVVLAVYSFNASRTSKVWGGFSLQWYVSLFRDSQIMSALYYTLLVAVLACVISTFVGTISAIGIHSMKERSRKVLLNINYLPVINPDIVTGISLMLVFSTLAIKAGLLTMLIAHITFCIPYVILSVLPKLKQMDRNLVEAALDLGATPIYTLRHIVLPEISSGIITGALLAFTLSIDDFVITFFTQGPNSTTMPVKIYSMVKFGVSPVVNAISTIFLVVITLTIVVVTKLERKE